MATQSSHSTLKEGGLTSPRERESHTPKRSMVRERRNVRSNYASWWLLVGLLTFAPLSFGAVEFWAVSLLELASLLLAVFWVVGAIRREEIYIELNSLAWAALGFQSFLVWQLATRHTIDRGATRDGLLLLFAYFLVFLVVFNEHWSPRWIRRLAFAVAGIGFLVAVLGILQFLAWNGKLYWLRPIEAGTPFGPYVNHNHFAGLMELTFPVVVGLVASKRLAKAWKALLTFFGAVMALATFMSLSRGGMIGLVLGVCVFLFFQLRRGQGRTGLITLGIVGTIVIGWLLWLGAGPVLERIYTLREFQQEPSLASRFQVAEDTLKIIRDHPLTGTGLGTFSLEIPRYLSKPTALTWDKAHDDYLELLSGVGLIGFTFVVWWIVGLFRGFMASFSDPAQRFPTVRLGAFCGCFSLLVHSLVDFNLQIPANALFFTVLAALATRRDHSGPPTEIGGTSPNFARSLAAR